MLDQRELRARLTDTLNGGSKEGWNDDEPAVVHLACELMQRRYYGESGPDKAAVGWIAALIREATAADMSPISEHDAVVVIQPALDVEAPASHVSAVDKLRVEVAAASLLSKQAGLDAASVDELLREAERLAFERGFHPPLVRRARSGPEGP